MIQAPVAVATEKAALEDIAIVYRGSSDSGHKYCKPSSALLKEADYCYSPESK